MIGSPLVKTGIQVPPQVLAPSIRPEITASDETPTRDLRARADSLRQTVSQLRRAVSAVKVKKDRIEADVRRLRSRVAEAESDQREAAEAAGAQGVAFERPNVEENSLQESVTTAIEPDADGFVVSPLAALAAVAVIIFVATS